MFSNLLGELVGTAVLIVFGGGVVANALLTRTKGHQAGWLAITTGWGFAVVLGVFSAKAAGSIQADINPAITVSKFLLNHGYSPLQAIATVGAQFVGAFLGAVLVWLAYWPHWKLTTDPALKLAVFCTQPQVYQPWANLLAEFLGAFFLILGIHAIFGSGQPDPVVLAMGPYLVGILVWAIGLSLGGTTGYTINPARDLAPRLAHSLLPLGEKQSSDWRYAWIPLVGPLLGALFGVWLGGFIFV